MTLARFRDLKAKFPNSEMPRWTLASKLEDAGRFEEAITEFRELVAMKPDYCIAWVHLGGCLLEAEHYDDAKAALEEGIRLAVAQDHEAPRMEAEALMVEVVEELEA